MELNEHKNIQNKDWRLQAITTLAKEFVSPSGAKHPPDSPVMLSSTIKFNQKLLTFGLPSITALFLDFSYNLWNESQLALKDENFLKSLSKFLSTNSVYPKDDFEFFNMIEMAMGSIVFSYCALESFANEIIPDDYVFETTRSDSKCVEKYNKNQIERHISLDTKLSEILPIIMSVDSPKGKSLWNKYIGIKNLRDRIIHMKSHDRKSTGPGEDSIWKAIIDRNNPNFALGAKDIIKYYFSKKEMPRWLKKFPY